MGKTERE
jgi:hypothetical protein